MQEKEKDLEEHSKFLGQGGFCVSAESRLSALPLPDKPVDNISNAIYYN